MVGVKPVRHKKYAPDFIEVPVDVNIYVSVNLSLYDKMIPVTHSTTEKISSESSNYWAILLAYSCN